MRVKPGVGRAAAASSSEGARLRANALVVAAALWGRLGSGAGAPPETPAP
jgi:hypothetical protein